MNTNSRLFRSARFSLVTSRAAPRAPKALIACLEVPIPRARTRSAGLVHLRPAIATRIAAMHSGGASLQTIAIALNRVDAPNPVGTRWTAGSRATRRITARV
jgi:hypothetical protein